MSVSSEPAVAGSDDTDSAADPALILTDEPTGTVDTETGEEITSLLREANERGNNILLVTHERRIAERPDRIVHVTDGTLQGIEAVGERR